MDLHRETRRARGLAIAAATTAVMVVVAAPAFAGARPASHASSNARSQSAVSKQAHAAWAKENRMAAAQKPAPRFVLTTAKTFTVNTTTDSDLANPSGTTCVDVATSKCSLRAAVDAANNLGKPVTVVLSSTTYTLTTATPLSVTNPAGTNIVGKGSTKTTIKGDGSGIITETPPTTSAPSPELFLTDVKLTGGSSTNGGALYLGESVSGATAVLDHDLISGNSALAGGGGIDAEGYDTLYLTNTTVSHNVAHYGGGVSSVWLDGQFTNSSIIDNSTSTGGTGIGAGIYSEDGVFDISGGSISNNTAGDGSSYPGDGGAIYDDGYADFTLTGVTVNGNTVTDGGDGGAIYAYYDEVDITKGSISNDSATGDDGDGGGIFIDVGAQVGLHGVTMTNDKVAGTLDYAYGGGAIYDYGEDYGNSLTIDSHTTITGANNSAILLYTDNGQIDSTITNSTLSDNTDHSQNGDQSSGFYGCGGAVCGIGYEYGQLDLQMTGDTVSHNSSTGTHSGGAITIDNYEYSGAALHLVGDTFRDNNAGPSGEGGAVDEYDGDDYTPTTLQTASDHFIDNTAGTSTSGDEGDGGAVWIYYYATYSDVGSTFSGNRALGTSSYGGAVDNDSYQSDRFTGTVFTGNSANTSGGYGGAVYSDNDGGDVYNDVTMSGNRAAYGGAIYGDTGAYQLEMNHSTVSGNTAGSSTTAGAGGGIFSDDATMSLTDSTVANNTATSISGTHGKGGGIYESGSSLGLRYTTVSGNVAGKGGGVYENGTGGTLLASIISANHASSHGAEQDCTVANTSSALGSVGGNVLGQSECVIGLKSNDKVTENPGLKSLASNGGPTKTHALTASSPAIDRGGYDCPSVDQRGEPRAAAHCDAGAYQRAPGVVTSVSPSKGKAGRKVTIKGRGFRFARQVRFGSAKATFVIVSDTEIRATVPKHGTGKVSVKVTTRDGSGKKGKFTYKN